MKKKRTRSLIILASLTLIALLAMQIYYIVRSATIKEEHFNQAVSMALCKVADQMCSNPESCSNWDSCCMNAEDGSSNCSVTLSEEQKSNLDSLLRYYMDYYHIDLDYKYEVVKADRSLLPGSKNSFGQKLITSTDNEYQLVLNFPGRRAFILKEMKGIFITSVILVLLLIAIFYSTIRALLKSDETLKRTTDFVNNMTHELNTPIANISLATSRLNKNDSTPERKQAYLNIITEETNKLRSQVERLLDISCLDDNSICIKPQDCDIHQLVRQAISSVQNKVPDAVIDQHLNAEMTAIDCDPMHLSNAIANLIDNAVKYSDHPAEVSVTTENTGGNVKVIISDKGIGISANDLKLIFDRYYRASTGDVHNVKGFGIGLSYVKSVIKAHGGSIDASSEPGKGSSFSITLPVKK